MSGVGKLKHRICNIPADFTYTELKKLLKSFGYIEYHKGKTSGSRVCFYREYDGHMINLHKPHPGDVMKQYAVRQVVQTLREIGELE